MLREMNIQSPKAKARGQTRLVTSAGILLFARKSVFLNHSARVQTAAPSESRARERCVPNAAVRVGEARVVEACVVNIGSFGKARTTEKKETTHARTIAVMLIPNAFSFPIALNCRLINAQNIKVN